MQEKLLSFDQSNNISNQNDDEYRHCKNIIMLYQHQHKNNSNINNSQNANTNNAFKKLDLDLDIDDLDDM